MLSVDEEIKAGDNSVCLAAGQDQKIYRRIYSGNGRYFSGALLTTARREGIGNCVFGTDSAEPPVEYQKFKGIDANGQVVWVDQPVKYVVRAYADCGNVFVPGPSTTMYQVCRFQASTVPAEQ